MPPTASHSPLTGSPLVIGVDGGGTKTVAWLAPLDDPTNTIVLGHGQAGPGNPRAAGFDVAQSNIATAIQAAFADAGQPAEPVAAACFGLAGAGRHSEQLVIAAWAAASRIAAQVKVTGDAEPILAAAAPDNCGIALICGTGSLAWGRNHKGETARCGGWGYLLGDEGSGYAIALAGLRAAMRSADGRDQPTLLLRHFQEELKADQAADIIDKIYSSQMTRERLAGLAKIAFDLAATDATASSIIEAAARELAELVGKLALHLGFRPGSYPIALAGGVLAGQSAYCSAILDEISSFGPAPSGSVTVAEPVRGAVALARLAAHCTTRPTPN